MKSFAEKFNEGKKYDAEFNLVFKMRLAKYLDPFYGFDIVKFDNDLKTPDGTSTREHVRNLYGAEAEKLIERLISI